MIRRRCHRIFESIQRSQRCSFATMAQLGFILTAAVGCTYEGESETESELTTRTTFDWPNYQTTYTETNVAHSAYGGVAYASNSLPGQQASFVNDGRRGSPLVSNGAYGWRYAYWASNVLSNVYTCNYDNWWVRVDFGGIRSINEITLFSLQNGFQSGADPTASTTTSYYGNVDFVLQYCPPNTTCEPNGTGWVTPSGGYITANSLAWNAVAFASVPATSVRAWLHCAQSTRAYIVELEAWQRTAGFCPSDPPKLYEAPSVGNATSNEIIIHDSDVYWANIIGGTPDQVRAWIHDNFYGNHAALPIWQIGRLAAAVAQMYDLVAPVDSCRASHYLELLRVIADELLSWRDDKGQVGTEVPWPYPTVDWFRNKVMAAWGFNVLCNGVPRWKTDVVLAGLFTYPMAAFARRVAANPAAFSSEYQSDAIRFTTAVFETYSSFRNDLLLQNSPNGVAYYKYPTTYSNCSSLSGAAGRPLSWNENLSFMKSLAEAAIAADSQLYRSSNPTPAMLAVATVEAPLVIAKDVKFLMDHANSSGHLLYWGDGAAYYVWDHGSSAGGGQIIPQDTGHAQFELGSLAVIHERKAALDVLLSNAGRSERIDLSPEILRRFATTFLRLIWNTGNLVGNQVNGEADGSATLNWNQECAGFIALAPYDPWVWVRCRDSIFQFAGKLREDNYAALLRYR